MTTESTGFSYSWLWIHDHLFRDAGLDRVEERRDSSGAWLLLRHPGVLERSP